MNIWGQKMTTEHDLYPWPYSYPKEPVALGAEIVGTGRTFGDFLAWAYSEVLDSQKRGILAEYLVMTALGLNLPYLSGDFYDLRHPDGFGIQVKASSAAQRWENKKVHRISFGTRATSRSELVDEELGLVTLTAEKRRWGAAWVFAVHLPSADDNPDTVRRELLDAGTWHFWVGSPDDLTTKSVPLLTVIANLGTGVTHEGLKAAVDRVVHGPSPVPDTEWKAKPKLVHWLEEERMHLVPEGALEAVHRTLSELTDLYGPSLQTAFVPGEVRFWLVRSRKIRISLEAREDLKSGKARLFRWTTTQRGQSPDRDAGEPVAWDDLSAAAVAALRQSPAVRAGVHDRQGPDGSQ